jgi:CubicO group peptidase (beta-lactamase class C family)
MLNRWPQLAETVVTDVLPECRLPDQRWAGVTLSHLLDMSTGNYESKVFQAVEAAAKMQTFFLADQLVDKLSFACTAWPKQSPAGDHAVYHSTDHFLLGVALNRFLKQQQGPAADFHRDILLKGVLEPAQPGPLLAYTQRTNDVFAQPFVFNGLLYTAGDVARIGQLLLAPTLETSGISNADTQRLRFRDRNGMMKWPLARGEGYAKGFWGFDMAPFLGCEAPAWVPFMSGYGGIIWALLPNNMVYYFFSDGGHGSWKDAVEELHKHQPICS